MEDDLNEMFQTNVVGNIRLFNLFLPLIKNGKTKKVVTISSGMTDEKLAVQYEIWEGALYSITKSATNMVTVKFQAEFKKEGIIFMGVCPGNVDTGHHDNRKYAVREAYYRILISAICTVTPDNLQKLMAMSGKFVAYAPHFRGMATTDEAACDVLSVIHKATMEANGGKLVSHLGNKQWL